MTSSEFAEWMAMEQIEPGEPLRSDYHAAMICHTLAMIHRRKGTKPQFKKYMLQYIMDTETELQIRPDLTLKQKLLGWKTLYEYQRQQG